MSALVTLQEILKDTCQASTITLDKRQVAELIAAAETDRDEIQRIKAAIRHWAALRRERLRQQKKRREVARRLFQDFRIDFYDGKFFEDNEEVMPDDEWGDEGVAMAKELLAFNAEIEKLSSAITKARNAMVRLAKEEVAE